MHWFAQSFRKVHILYVSPPWARNRGESFDAQEYVRRYVDAGVDAVELYCKDHHGVCYFPCSEGLPYPRDVVGELGAATRASGIRFIAYFSVGLDAYAMGVHPEWQATDARGIPLDGTPFHTACLTSPYRDYALRQLGQLIQRYPIDGLWLDIVPYAWDVPQTLWMQNELRACYCMSCRAGYEAATGRPLPGPNPTPAERRATYEYRLGNTASFLRAARALLDEHRPSAFLTYNGANGPGDPLCLGDLVSIEGHAPNYGRQSFICRWARGVGKPFEVLTPAGLPGACGGWNSIDAKPPEMMRLEAGLMAAHGGSAVFGQVPYPNGATAMGHYDGFGYAFRPLMSLEQAGLVAPESVSDVALVLSSRPSMSPETWGTQFDGVEAVHQALLDGHVQFDILPRAAGLDRYRLVVLADQVALGDEELASIIAFAAASGRLLVIGTVGLIDGNGKPRSALPLTDLLGIEDQGDAGWPFTYVYLADQRLKRGIPATPLLNSRSPRRTRVRDAEVLAEFVRPETARTDSTTVLWGNPPPDESVRLPGITLRQAGAGDACYVAISLAGNVTIGATTSAGGPGNRGFENTWMSALLRNVVNLLVPDRILTTDAPPGIEIVLNRHGRRFALQVVDTLRVQPEHLNVGPDATLPAGWTVRLDRARIGPLASVSHIDGSPVKWTQEGDRYVLRLPPVDLHAAFVLEPQ